MAEQKQGGAGGGPDKSEGGALCSVEPAGRGQGGAIAVGGTAVRPSHRTLRFWREWRRTRPRTLHSEAAHLSARTLHARGTSF